MPSRKRSIEAVDSDSHAAAPPLLHRIRNMWQFANLCQWIYIFGKAARIDESIDIEQLETECLKPDSRVLADIALALLKLVSSHRGLTYDILDDQARKQYLVRAPDRNPFGDREEPDHFSDFDIITKIQVLQQMTQWVMVHPERIRDKMEEQKDTEQTSWRVEPYGWDSHDRTYFVLDDNRVYRMTEAPPAPRPPKAKKSKSFRSGRRSSKRRRTALAVPDEQADGLDDEAAGPETVDDSLGGMTWECLAVTLDEVRRLLEGLRKSRDENEKVLRRQLEDHLVPILEKQEESRKRKELQRERELLNLAKMANAKRSSRIAGRMEQQKREQEEKEEELQQREVEAASRLEERRRFKMEEERNSRLASREKRLQEREARRLQHEEELANLSEDNKNVGSGTGRLSERRLQVEIERNRQALVDLEQEEEDWVFDCICGMHGHVDDGTHSVACERCNVWYHSKCLGISEEEADRPEFQFVCTSCVRREEESKAPPKPTIKLKLNRPRSAELQSHTEFPAIETTKNQHSVVQPPSKVDAQPPSHSMPGGPSEDAITAQGPKETQQPAPIHGHVRAPHAGLPTAEGVDNSQVPAAGATQYSTAGVAEHSGSQHTIRAPTDLGPVAAADREATQTTASVQSDRPSAPATTPVAIKPPNASDQEAEASLNTPHIARDIYRAAHVENGALPSKAGFSPTKHSPQEPKSVDRNKASGTGPIIPPTILSPSSHEPILTPPTKPSEPMRPNGSH